ncbi:MAG: PepSY domain-containing protein [Hydrogenimonas sp.]|nr:PepSY domain-containing protein [Hydrogenimonas sp.]
MYVNSIAVHGDKVVAAVDKHLFFVIDKESGKVLKRVVAEPNRNDIGGAVTLARFVRDLHYGRGYVDSELSLWINDYGAIALAWLSISGFIIWWRIKRKNGAKVTRKVIKTHSNIFALAAALPLVVLAVTGIFLDHAKALGAFMKSIQVPSYLLPPVYSGLSHDIWSVDFDGKQYRIGNRYGVFASSDLKEWRLENSGFAYRMFREGKRLYVSGMGAPNRVFENGKWRVLANTPHMFKDIVNSGGEKVFFSTHKPNQPLPSFNSITLYTLLLSLHDGTFFSSWWVWVNDAAAILLLLLIATGAVRWQLKKRRAKRLMLKR